MALASTGLRRTLGAILLARGVVTPGELARALDLQLAEAAMLGEILVAHGIAPEGAVLDALAEQLGLGRLHALPDAGAAALALVRRMPPALAVRFRAVPVGRVGGAVLIATAAPERMDELRAALPPALLPCRFAVASRAAVERRMGEAMGPALARRAECRPPRAMSCRDWERSRAGTLVTGAAVLAAAAFVLAPAAAVQAATLAGLAAMAANLALRLLALRALRRAPGPAFRTRRGEAAAPLPRLSILVPLHDEPRIVPALLRRMEALRYPRSALEVLLVVEAGDRATRAALADAALPAWMRAVPVPDGRPRTKPRAMNYALNFARGDFVGVFDAEDAPEADTLLRVARRFQAAGPDLACLQGRLDYYNASRNWMARCFAIEYATWFRLVLPGIARLGLVVPLGGTTVFFRGIR
ncbi:glycosyltransferase [Jannaschia sp. W003]|uniref:glycosyltransferase n=1 Tax=Jannaschia sp. W003 TaxID=2867012 RepID=UPI0021A2FDCF|nr:glycosyltransferase [Jannaschia sp. W003]UWQ21078.1 glycosyltransferase [Jannaschia sp. W003]